MPGCKPRSKFDCTMLCQCRLTNDIAKAPPNLCFIGIAVVVYLAWLGRHNADDPANLAFNLQRAGKYQEAIVQAEKAIHANPDDALGYYVRAASTLMLMEETHQIDPLQLSNCKKAFQRAVDLSTNEALKEQSRKYIEVIDKQLKKANEM
jgi:hypothetical protein